MTKVVQDTSGENWEAIKKALSKGEAVGIPTETVYGLAARADSEEAVQKIFKLKKRPSDNPLIVHIGRREQLDEFAADVSRVAKALADFFWPGPLTLVLNSKGSLPKITTAGLDSIAIRMPGHPVALKLLRELDFPLAAPSANISGNPSPSLASHVLTDFEGKLDWILDAGPTEHGLESTVVDAREEKLRVLRPGALSKVALNQFLSKNGFPQLQEASEVKTSEGQDGQSPISPGMKYRHYAPQATVYILSQKEAAEKEQAGAFEAEKLLMLVSETLPSFIKYEQREMGLSAQEWSQRLFAVFREADQKGFGKIIAIDPPEGEHHEALMNRLHKAASQE